MDLNAKLADYPISSENRIFFSQLFATMPPAVTASCTFGSCEKDHSFIRSGDRCDTVFLLLCGTVCITNELDNGVIYSFDNTEAPAFLGETESFADFPLYRASVECKTPCRYLCIPREKFLQWMKQSNDAMFILIRHITRKIAAQSSKDRNLLFSTGEQRLVFQLIRYYESGNKDGVCTIRVQRYQLADELCISIKTVNRCIARLKEKGLIAQSGRVITVTEEQYRQLMEYLKDTN